MKIIKKPGQLHQASAEEQKIIKSAIPLKKSSSRFLLIAAISIGSIFAGAEVAHRILKPDVTVKVDLKPSEKI